MMQKAYQIHSDHTSVALTDSFRSYAFFTGRIGRRVIPSLTVIIAVIVLRRVRDDSAARLGNEAFVTGYSLATIVVFLLLLAARKRIVSANLGRVAIWQRSHHYLGVMSMGAYALHAGAITTGWLESLLALSFWAIGLSGLLSWYVNRTSPQKLRAAGLQVLRHDIPERKRIIGQQAHQLALSAAGNSESSTLADHYRDQLQEFFVARRSIFYRLKPTGTKRRRLLAELENVDRYLNNDGRSQRQQMSTLLQSKDDLDFQSAIQNRIRFCASIHTWLLGSFIVLAVVHIVVAHLYSSSW